MDGAQGIGGLFSGMRSSASGLSAERVRIDVIARNIANAQTTNTPDGGPYRRQVVHFAPVMEKLASGQIVESGVRVSGVRDDMSTPFEVIHDPGHPDADSEGNVQYPNVHATREMADLITAMRAYEANLSAQENFMRMAERALRLMQ
jgi:flagellar basal-body rod protein FlgC